MIKVLMNMVGRPTIPVTKETRDMVREVKGHERTYDELLQELINND